MVANPAANYLFKDNNRNTRTRCEIYSKLICSGVFIVNFEHISHLVLVLLLLTLSKYLQAGKENIPKDEFGEKMFKVISPPKCSHIHVPRSRRKGKTKNNVFKLYVLVMSRTRFRVNPHSIVAWMSRISLLEAGAKSEGEVTATRLEPRTT